MSLNWMILYSKLKNGLWNIVTKSHVVTKFNVTKSRMHCTQRVRIILCTMLAYIEAALNALNLDWSQLSIAVACKCASTVFGIKFQWKWQLSSRNLDIWELKLWIRKAIDFLLQVTKFKNYKSWNLKVR